MTIAAQQVHRLRRDGRCCRSLGERRETMSRKLRSIPAIVGRTLAILPHGAAAERFCSVPMLAVDTSADSAHVREQFGGCPAKPLTRFERDARADQTRRLLVRHRFGRGAAVRAPAKRPLRFFGLRPAPARVTWTLNPLVVGSIPTRPTNKLEGLAGNRWALVISRSPAPLLLGHPRRSEVVATRRPKATFFCTAFRGRHRPTRFHAQSQRFTATR